MSDEKLLEWKPSREYPGSFHAKRGWLRVRLHKTGRKWWAEVERPPEGYESDEYRTRAEAEAWAEAQARECRDTILPAECAQWSPP